MLTDTSYPVLVDASPLATTTHPPTPHDHQSPFSVSKESWKRDQLGSSIVCVGNLLDGLNAGDRPGTNREVKNETDAVHLTGFEDALVVAVHHIVVVLDRRDLDMRSGRFELVEADVRETNVIDEPLL